MSALFPGYKHVSSFGADSEYESDGEEVEYVALDLGTVEPTLVPSSSSYRLIGLDTPTPFLQLSGTMLMGQHVPLLGTELLFTEASSSANANTSTDEPQHEPDRDCSAGKKPLVHVANTERRIRFKEVELKPKRPPQTASTAIPGSHENGMDGAKTSNLAKKVKSQMAHVMSGSAGPSRGRGRGRGKGRGGKKRGSTAASSVGDQPNSMSQDKGRSKGKEPDVGHSGELEENAVTGQADGGERGRELIGT